MRILSGAELTALASSPCPLALLVEMDLTVPQYLSTGGNNLSSVDGSITYAGLQGLGKVGVVSDSPSEIKPLQFELSGVPVDKVSLAETEPVRVKAVRIKLGLFDPSTYRLLRAILIWSGKLDMLTFIDGSPTASIAVQAEHDGADLTRPSTSLYTDAEQQRLYPGDLFFQYVTDQIDQRIVWPDASFGRT